MCCQSSSSFLEAILSLKFFKMVRASLSLLWRFTTGCKNLIKFILWCFLGAYIDNEWQDVYLCETGVQVSSLQLQAEEVTGTGITYISLAFPTLITFCVFLSKLKMLRQCTTAYLKSSKEKLTLLLRHFQRKNPSRCLLCCMSSILEFPKGTLAASQIWHIYILAMLLSLYKYNKKLCPVVGNFSSFLVSVSWPHSWRGGVNQDVLFVC